MKVVLLLLCLSAYTQLGIGVQIDRSGRDIKTVTDGDKNTADFCEKWGYPAQEHDVMTKDGYTLTLFRIPHSPGSSNRKHIPVLMQHGIYLNSDQWVLRGPHDLPFLLSEMGFDVWMSNTRGTKYSRHRRYTFNDIKFWNYSPDEISAYDLPAMIDYVLNTTGMEKLSYIGHSRGCAMAIMLLSSKPEYNAKIHMLQFLAPVIYTTYAPCPIYYIAGNRKGSLMTTNTFEKLMTMSGMGRVLAMPQPVKVLLRGLCSTGTALDRLCPFLAFFVNGEGYANFNYSLTPMMLDHFTEGVSTKELIHLQQISANGEFQMYDYKKKGNIRHYGTKRPPVYNITLTTAPVYNYYGTHDLFISERDLSRFIRQLPNFKSSFRIINYNHLDYFWGKNANEVLFPRFLKDIAKFHNKIILS